MKYVRLLTFIFALTATFNPHVTIAQQIEITGKNNPSFKIAVEEWLAGNDHITYPMLVELANSNNRAAQILLARFLSTSGHTSQEYFKTLSLVERRYLRRKRDGSKFGGKDWLTIASADTPLARAFKEFHEKETVLASLRVLLKNEEHSIILSALNVMYSQRWPGILQLSAEGLLDARYQSHIDFAFERDYIDTHGLTEETIKYLKNRPNYTLSENSMTYGLWTRPRAFSAGKNITYPEIILKDKELFSQLKGFTKFDIRMKPARFLCSRICPTTPVTCGIALRAQFSNYSHFISNSYSPIESLIATTEYRNSARFPEDMRRLILLPQMTLTRTPRDPERVRQIDACFADFLVAE